MVDGAVVDELLARTSLGGTSAWYLTDKLDSVRDVLNSSGSAIDHVVYDSFGSITTETSASNGDRFKFAGMEFDATTRQYFDRARWYGQAVAKFLSMDPLGFAARDADMFRYVGNSPPNSVDPTGTLAQPPGTQLPDPVDQAPMTLKSTMTIEAGPVNDPSALVPPGAPWPYDPTRQFFDGSTHSPVMFVPPYAPWRYDPNRQYFPDAAVLPQRLVFPRTPFTSSPLGLSNGGYIPPGFKETPEWLQKILEALTESLKDNVNPYPKDRPDPPGETVKISGLSYEPTVGTVPMELGLSVGLGRGGLTSIDISASFPFWSQIKKPKPIWLETEPIVPPGL
jgi:RHS repeat-associated protein